MLGLALTTVMLAAFKETMLQVQKVLLIAVFIIVCMRDDSTSDVSANLKSLEFEYLSEFASNSCKN